MGVPLSASFHGSVVTGAKLAADLVLDPVAAPFVEGARARAIADLCERDAIPALLVERTGQVLLANRYALRYLGGVLRLEVGHMVGRTSAATTRIRHAIDMAIDSTQGESLSFTADLDPKSADGLYLTVFSYPNPSPFQLIKAVAVIGQRADAAQVDLGCLRDLLNRA